jgi:hypothetical protein
MITIHLFARTDAGLSMFSYEITFSNIKIFKDASNSYYSLIYKHFNLKRRKWWSKKEINMYGRIFTNAFLGFSSMISSKYFYSMFRYTTKTLKYCRTEVFALNTFSTWKVFFSLESKKKSEGARSGENEW